MRKTISFRKKLDVFSKRINKLIVFASIFGLAFAFDNTIIDSVYLPKNLLFTFVLLLFLIVNFRKATYLFKYSRILQFSSLFLGFLYVLAQNSANWYFGDSQRLNGLIFYLCTFVSLISGSLIWELNLSRQLLLSLACAGFLSSALVLSTFFKGPVDKWKMSGWLLTQDVGGLNENFKSIFISVSLLSLLLFLVYSKTKLQTIMIMIGVVVHLSALIAIGNLQGIGLIVLSVLIFQILIRENFKMFGLVLLLALGSYSLIVARPPSVLIQDSSIKERILLAREATKYLETAPIIIPDFIRISTLDFSSQTLSSSPNIKFWVDDVHNFYLQLANSLGIIPTIVFVSFFIATISLALRLNHPVKTRVLSLGIVSICVAYGITLLITMGTMFYAFAFFLLFGMLIGMAVRDKTESKIEFSEKVKGACSKVITKLTFRASAISVILVGIVCTYFVTSDYALQRDFVSSLQRYNAGNFDHLAWENEKSVLAKSHDLLFLYKVTAFFKESSVCDPALEVAMYMKSMSPGHFLTKEAGKLSATCLSSP